MNVLIFIAGVADPKWPLPPTADSAALQAHADRYAILSPFDESALALALKLRDADAGVAIHALVAGPESLARKVAEWRLDSVRRLAAGGAAAWDASAFATSLASAAAAVASDAALVLTGRELGDLDDGAVAPLLARSLRLPHVGLTVGVEFQDGSAWATRQRAGRIERVRLPGRALLSVTNDPQNRLRHPLLKNVMAARKLRIDAVEAGAAAANVTLAAMQPVVASPRAGACRLLQGSAEAQAEALAQVLLEGVPA